MSEPPKDPEPEEEGNGPKRDVSEAEKERARRRTRGQDHPGRGGRNAQEIFQRTALSRRSSPESALRLIFTCRRGDVCTSPAVFVSWVAATTAVFAQTGQSDRTGITARDRTFSRPVNFARFANRCLFTTHVRAAFGKLPRGTKHEKAARAFRQTRQATEWQPRVRSKGKPPWRKRRRKRPSQQDPLEGSLPPRKNRSSTAKTTARVRRARNRREAAERRSCAKGGRQGIRGRRDGGDDRSATFGSANEAGTGRRRATQARATREGDAPPADRPDDLRARLLRRRSRIHAAHWTTTSGPAAGCFRRAARSSKSFETLGYAKLPLSAVAASPSPEPSGQESSAADLFAGASENGGEVLMAGATVASEQALA